MGGSCHPISLNTGSARSIEPLLIAQPVTFPALSLVGLTGFVAFEITARYQGQESSSAFVFNLPISGLPPERDRQILQSIVSNRSQFIRYLLFLLADEPDSVALQELIQTRSPSRAKANSAPLQYELPLIEELVRAYSREPERIDHIARLVDDLHQSGSVQDVLPEGFERIWQAFLAARRLGVSS